MANQSDELDTLLEAWLYQVQRNSLLVAIEDNLDSYTYQQVDQWSNEIASRLTEAGVQSGQRIGTLLERSAELFVSWLAILKLGASYVPLDPTNPSERIEWIIKDSDISFLLSKSLWSNLYNIPENCIKIDLDNDINRKINYFVENKIPNSSDNIAYTIYTSGSTGKPKGVQIQCDSILKLVQNMTYIDIQTGDAIAQLSNASFDAVTFEVWGTWLNGAKIVIAPQEILLSPFMFSDWLQQKEITSLFITVALFNQMAQYKPDLFSSLKYVLFGGEASNARWIQAVLEAGPPTHLCNIYGPTECTTFALSYEITNKAFEVDAPIPIGTAINDTSTYILDQQQQSIAIGEVGELYIGGAGVAVGYWHQPELTAEKFVILSELSNERLYRTGDLVRLQADRNIEFIGRVDHQIKLRGYRIELGEIEQTIESISGICEAIVRVVEPNESPYFKEKVLAAYYSTDQIVDKVRLQMTLQTKLPNYMIPSVWIEVDHFQLNHNGKVDRQQLPTIRLQDQMLYEYIAPTSKLEKCLADIWSNVLGKSSISMNDHFFRIGGQSLLAAQVLMRIEEKLGKRSSLRMLFDYPVFADLAVQLQQLPDEESIHSIPIVMQSHHRYPLAPSQKRLWFLNQLEPHNRAYHIPLTFSLRGILNIKILEQAIHQLIEEQASLRTIFGEENGTPYQEIKSNTMTIHKTSITASDSAIPLEIQELLSQEAWQPFDLTTGPLVRVRIIELNPNHHILSWVVHHIVFDGWSEKILRQRLNELYSGLNTGSSDFLLNEPNSLRYVDYAQWQNQPEQAQYSQTQLAYWKKLLSGELPVIDLSTDRARPHHLSSLGERQQHRLPTAITSKLHQWCQNEQTTVPITLLSIFNILLYRYTGQTDLIVGMPVAGRARTEWEKLIGFFVNTIAIRTQLNPDHSVQQYMSQVQQHFLSSYMYQDVSFEQIVHDIQPERQPSYTPIFQMMFIHHNYNQEDHLIIQPWLDQDTIKQFTHVKFDLTLGVYENNQDIYIEFQYRSDILKDSQVEKLYQQYLHLLESAISYSQQSIECLRLTNTPVIEDILQKNSTLLSLAQVNEKSIYERLEQQMQQQPNHIVLEDKDEQITYKQLSLRVEQLAYYLIEYHPVERGDRIGIYMEKSIETVVVMLALLKLGICMVPIDIRYPLQRQQYMIEHAHPKYILVHQQTLMKSQFTVPTINVDSKVYTSWSAELAVPTISQTDDLAYIVYTSGSTGNPKAIVNTHTGIINYIDFMQQELQFNLQDCVLQLASFSVDGFFRDLIAPLVLGVKVVVVDGEQTKDHDQLLELLSKYHITCLLSTVPSMLKVLCQTIEQQLLNVSSVRLILSSGEVLSNTVAKHVKIAFPKATLINLYGPTETTLTTTFKRIHSYDETVYDVGCPIPNTFICILDAQKMPVPRGIIGEVYIGGKGVTQGYYGDIEQTQQYFSSYPWLANSLLYKTGDRGLLLEDGRLILKGRLDRQVKVRGYRIELNEVEAMLETAHEVDTAVVIAQKNEDGNTELAGFILPYVDTVVDLSSLWKKWKSQFPDYMIPSKLFIIQNIPQTPNGKIDRKQLISMTNNPLHHREYETVMNKREQQLAQIWQDVLQCKDLKADENFFAVGGHSLLATQVISRIRTQWAVDIPLSSLFDYPTIRELDQNFDEITTKRLAVAKIERRARVQQIDSILKH